MFESAPGSHIPTTVDLSLSVKTITVCGRSVHMHLWDTPGQERYQAVASIYLSHAKGIVLVYDITSKESFQDLRQWVGVVKKFAPQTVQVLLVGRLMRRKRDKSPKKWGKSWRRILVHSSLKQAL